MPSAKIAWAYVAVSVVEAGLAHAEVDRRGGEDGPDAERAEHGARDLRGPVGRDLAPREALGGRERERHSRVDVTAGHLAERVDERGDDQAEGERDAQQVGAGDGGRAVSCQRQRRDDGTRTDQHQQRGAQRLGERALPQRVRLHPLSSSADWDCDSTMSNRVCGTYSSETGASSVPSCAVLPGRVIVRSLLSALVVTLAVAPAAVAQTPIPTPTPTPPPPAPTPTPPPAPAPARGTAGLKVENAIRDGKTRLQLKGDTWRVRGTVKPFVAGQTMRVRFSRGGKAVRTKRVKLKPGPERDRDVPRRLQGRRLGPLHDRRDAQGDAAAGGPAQPRRARAGAHPVDLRRPARRDRAPAPARPQAPPLLRPAQRDLRRGDPARGDGVAQGERRGAQLQRLVGRDPRRARRARAASGSATRTRAATSRPTSRARCSR